MAVEANKQNDEAEIQRATSPFTTDLIRKPASRLSDPPRTNSFEDNMADAVWFLLITAIGIPVGGWINSQVLRANGGFAY